MMERYLCKVGYLGWNFRGSSVQPGVRTVEGEMERVLEGKVRFLSRTDAGVSAMNNHAVCTVKKDPLSANDLPDVWVTGRVILRERPRVFWRWYRYYWPGEVEVPEDLLRVFLGRHDFSSFAIPEGKDPWREIIRFASFTLPGFTVFDVVGKSFLRQMVRRLVNAVVLHVKGELNALELLEHPLSRAVPPAPAEGLVLLDVGVQPRVPSISEAVERARRILKEEWRLYRTRSLVLSNRWLVR